MWTHCAAKSKFVPKARRHMNEFVPSSIMVTCQLCAVVLGELYKARGSLDVETAGTHGQFILRASQEVVAKLDRVRGSDFPPKLNRLVLNEADRAVVQRRTEAVATIHDWLEMEFRIARGVQAAADRAHRENLSSSRKRVRELEVELQMNREEIRELRGRTGAVATRRGSSSARTPWPRSWTWSTGLN